MTAGQKGRAGELYVAAQLSHRGWDVGLLGAGAKRHDLVATRPEATIAVQVKTTASISIYDVGVLIEEPCEKAVDDEWVIFVSLRAPDERPAFHIVPRRILATFVWCGTRHVHPNVPVGNDAPRSVKPRDFPRFKEAWDFLLTPPADVPWLLDEGGFWQWVEDVPLRERLASPVRATQEEMDAWPSD